MKIHYQVTDWKTACGRLTELDNASTFTSWVTCKTCNRIIEQALYG